MKGKIGITGIENGGLIRLRYLRRGLNQIFKERELSTKF